MKIGNGWTKTNEKDGSTFISFSLDKAILELFPNLKNCNFTASFVKAEDRKQENSPSWNLSISKRTEQTKKSSDDAEKEIIATKEKAAEDLISEEDIPF